MLYHILNRMAKDSIYNQELRAKGRAEEARESECLYIKAEARFLRNVRDNGGYCTHKHETGQYFLFQSTPAGSIRLGAISEDMFRACIAAGISEV